MIQRRQTDAERARARHNARVVRQVRFQVRFTQTREQANENIDRMMRQNRSVCG